MVNMYAVLVRVPFLASPLDYFLNQERSATSLDFQTAVSKDEKRLLRYWFITLLKN